MPPGAESANPEDVYVDPIMGEEVVGFDPEAITLAEFKVINLEPDDSKHYLSDHEVVTFAEMLAINRERFSKAGSATINFALGEKGDFTLGA